MVTDTILVVGLADFGRSMALPPRRPKKRRDTTNTSVKKQFATRRTYTTPFQPSIFHISCLETVGFLFLRLEALSSWHNTTFMLRGPMQQSVLGLAQFFIGHRATATSRRPRLFFPVGCQPGSAPHMTQNENKCLTRHMEDDDR